MKTLVIADVSNLYLTAKSKFNARVDYAKLMRYALDGSELYRAIAYGALGEQDQTNFFRLLNGLHFERQFKPYRVYEHDDGTTNRKMDWDVKIALDVVRCVNRFDQLALCSADGDFAPLVDYVRESGVFVHVLGVNISTDLKESANSFFELTEQDLYVPELEAK